jgi:apolipoprotein N-acyltransferase
VKPLGLALLSALLLILVFPRFDFAWLAPLCLVPMFVAIALEPNARKRLLIGAAAGFVYWFGVCYWISGVLAQFGGMPPILVALAFFLFCLLRGLPIMAFCWLGGYVVHRPWAVIALAALWTGLERVYGPFNFAWLLLGNAGIDMGVPMRLAPFTGVYGLSFIFAMMNAAVALLILRRPRRELAPLLALPLLYLLPPMPEIDQGNQNAVVVQPNIDERQEWTKQSTEDTIRRLVTQSMDIALGSTPPPRIILWPEVPAPFYETDQLFRSQAAQLAQVTKTPLLTGVVSFTPQQAPLNSALLVSPDGSFGPRYDKMHLVPFGEQTPPMFSWIGKISSEAGSFEPGKKIVTFEIAGGKVGSFICYESVFPHFVREFARDGATVLVNLSNDGYFSRTAAREQHLLLVRMRAAENRRWIIRATNDGITATIDPVGRAYRRLTPFRQAAGRVRFAFTDQVTPYTKYGDWFVWLCLAAGLTAAFTPILLRRL